MHHSHTHIIENPKSMFWKTTTYTQLETRATEGVFEWETYCNIRNFVANHFPFLSHTHIIANVHWVQTIRHSYFAWVGTLVLCVCVLCVLHVHAFCSPPSLPFAQLHCSSILFCFNFHSIAQQIVSVCVVSCTIPVWPAPKHLSKIRKTFFGKSSKD